MFAEAYQTASHFTKPVVVSRRDHSGKCAASIGTFVMINKEGWAVTAFHIVEEVENLLKSARIFKDTEASKAAIYANAELHKKERSRQLKALPKFAADTTTDSSAWWAGDGMQPKQYICIPAVDLAFVYFEAFDGSSVQKYPIFKHPAKPMQPGRSLCRLGFPFHTIEPVFDASRNVFQLPPGAVPLPFFPIEGIHTRVVEVQNNLNPPPPFKLRLIETSSPGLRGQSGGPIFDHRGVIWGIQTKTAHFPLGFSPPVPNGRPNEKEHQFLNVGWGVHMETVVGAMRENGIDFAVSDY